MCKSTCASDADCAPPNVCINSSCGLRPPGASCAGPADCQSGFCAQGVCCTTACNASCMSCALVGNLGTCKPIAGRWYRSQGAVQRGGRGDLREDRLLRRQRRLPAARGRHPVRPAVVPERLDHGDARPHLRRKRHLPPVDDAIVRHLRLQRHDLQRRLRRRQRLRARQRLQRRLVRIEAPRPAVRRPPANATAATASRASAARRPCAATASRATSPAWRGSCNPVGADDDGTARRLHPESPLRVQRQVRRQRRLPQRPHHHQLRDRLVQRVRRSRRSATATGRAPACRPPMSCAPFACGARRPAGRPAPATATAPAGFTCMSRRLHQPESQRRRLRRRDRMFQRQLHRRLLLRVRQLRQLQLLRGRHQAGDLPAGARRARIPTAICMSMPASTCGTTGSCDGSGQCATYPTGTTCMPATCSASQLTVFTCNAAHQCASQVTDCSRRFACDGSSACKASCADPADCAAGFTCNAPQLRAALTGTRPPPPRLPALKAFRISGLGDLPGLVSRREAC